MRPKISSIFTSRKGSPGESEQGALDRPFHQSAQGYAELGIPKPNSIICRKLAQLIGWHKLCREEDGANLSFRWFRHWPGRNAGANTAINSEGELLTSSQRLNDSDSRSSS